MATQSFPCMRFHPTESDVMVENQEQLDALGPFWRETPYTPDDVVQWRAAQAVADKPHVEGQDEGEPHAPRSRR